ncbi:ATP-binding protein [Shewanella intestini]|uniref:histidine kinase n=1 Tax=Shewanella intestini TaxID=2017544 RepID=A0ABS5HXJ9_9GAMM|nr:MULTISPECIES: ATP-binding protein [Shewanella]MBR9726421.1 two-component sensor histidine kinase [Shewanella intestini]MRG35013.1 two-component sensor histidine kinase [Shewanella sp. XMDDZSB0408]
MKRLFISLYLLLSLSFLGIGWTLDSLWQRNVDDTGEFNSPLIAFASLLAQIPEKDRQIYLDNITAEHPIPLALHKKDNITLSNGVVLKANEVLSTETEDNHHVFFIAVDDHVLIAGPVDVDPRAQLRGLFTLFFYLALALVALVWVWPLSRDLKNLREATKAFGEAHWDTRIKLAKSSQVSPLARTFNDMASHIGALIDNQKHLTNAISHEIRTPLGRLKFALALLPQYCQPSSSVKSRNDFLQEMECDITEMENLLQELLTYASLETNYVEPEMENCELVKICQQMIKRLQLHNSITINWDCRIEECYVKGEMSLIERAIQNLITNAQRYAESIIIVSLSAVGEQIKLSVTNDGPEIPLEDQKHIFKPFYRSKLQHDSNKGHGLGLAIISRIMNRHRGRITINSNAKQTTFSLLWPQLPLNK